MCDVRAAWSATLMLAFGVLRLRMQSRPVSEMGQRSVAARPHVDVRLGRLRAGRPRRVVAIERQTGAVDLQRAAIAAKLEPAIVDPADIGAKIGCIEVFGIERHIDRVGVSQDLM